MKYFFIIAHHGHTNIKNKDNFDRCNMHDAHSSDTTLTNIIQIIIKDRLFIFIFFVKLLIECFLQWFQTQLKNCGSIIVSFPVKLSLFFTMCNLDHCHL